MSDPTPRDDGTGRTPSSSDESDLSARLKSLETRLDQASAHRQETEDPRPRPASDSRALGQAMRLSAEFIAGVMAGGVLGYLVDGLAGTKPWGLIVCLILGFCAGMLNLMRAAGLAKPARYDEKP
ncbi:AtpZ/AtpI family protein [Salinarimonas soli]|uniref:ATP synthase protein I n=1 Tax=Salinarimonas soli TaxID=1638099 RepID=A0A5B2VBU9_9HYPH|nr:AtpZ/AtpI family protein [Salinarimonas soli]KAA2236216.1 ATP F0F1 synthase subunit I [Salinarimonas soli]